MNTTTRNDPSLPVPRPQDPLPTLARRLQWGLPVLIALAASSVVAGFYWLAQEQALPWPTAHRMALLVAVVTLLTLLIARLSLLHTLGRLRTLLDDAEHRRALADAQLERRAHVAALSARLQQAHDPADLAQVLLSELAQRMAVQQALCCLWDEDEQQLVAAARYAGEGPDAQAVITRRPRLGTLLSECARYRRSILIERPGPDFPRVQSGLGDAEPVAVLIEPVEHAGRLFAVLELASLQGFTPHDRALLQDAAPVFAMSLDMLVRAQRSERLLEETRANEEHSRLLLSAMGEGVWGMDVAGNTSFVNRAALSMLGWQEHEVLGRPVYALLALEDGRAEAPEDWPILCTARDGVPRRVADGRFRHRDGHALPVEYIATAVRQGDHLAGAVVVFQDLSQRQAAEADVASARAHDARTTRLKDVMLGNVSREVRMAMNAVVGMSHVLLKSPLQPSQRRSVERMLVAGRHLLGVVNDMVDYTRLEAGELVADHRPFVLSHLMERVLAQARVRAEIKGLHLSWATDPEVPEHLEGDPQHLAQVLDHVCEQAVARTPAGGAVAVRVRLLTEGLGSLLLRFEVHDPAPAWTDVELAELLAGDQLPETVHEDGSAGLGLMMARLLAQWMGGDVGRDPQTGGGQTFWFTTEVVRGTATEADDTARRAQHLAALAGARVLVVDDDPIDQEVVGELLRDVGLVVVRADHGQQALERLNEQAVDLVLMDLRMPVLDGLATTRALRQQAAWADLPVVAMTANVMPQDLHHCTEAGMNDHLAKPIEPDELLRLVLKWVPAHPPGGAP